MIRGTDTLHFYYDAQGKPAIVLFNGAAYGYLYNVQGDVVALFNEDSDVTVRYRYGAWGELLNCWGPEASTVGFWQPFRYRGYLWDWETGDYYCRSRQYRPGWGRFISTDTRVKDSLYCYCSSDPINRADGDGFDSIYANTDIYLVNGVGNNAYFIAEGTRVEIIDEGANCLTVSGPIYSFARDGWEYGEYYMDRSEVSSDLGNILLGTRDSFKEYDHSQRFYDIVLMIRNIRAREGLDVPEIDSSSPEAFTSTATLSFQTIFPESELEHDGNPGPKTRAKFIEYVASKVPPYNGLLPSILFSQFPKRIKPSKVRRIEDHE